MRFQRRLPGALRLLPALMLATTLVACSVFAPSKRERTSELIERVQSMAIEGRAEDALALLEAEVAAAKSKVDPFRVAYTRGWLHQRIADEREGDERYSQLDRAHSAYENALALRPKSADTLKSLALVERDLGCFEEAIGHARSIVSVATDATAAAVGWILEGDLHLEPTNPSRDPRLALAAYRRAFEAVPNDSTAPQRIVDFHMAAIDERNAEPAAVAAEASNARSTSPDTAADPTGALLDDARAFAHSGAYTAALAGVEALIDRCEPNASAALEDWLELQVRQRALKPRSLGALTIREPCEPLADALTELDELVRHPDKRVDARKFWDASERRAVLVIQALHELARQAEADGNDRQASDIYQRAWAAETAYQAFWAPSKGESVVCVELALDMLIFFHKRRDDVEFRAEAAEWLATLVSRRPLVDFLDREQAEGASIPLNRTDLDARDVHTVLGLVFGEVGVDAWKGKAPRHLQRAVELDPGGPKSPSPRLLEVLADGLAKNASPMDAYLEAGYSIKENGSAGGLGRLYDSAAEHMRESSRKLRELEELAYPGYGWYVGVSGALTDGGVSSQEFQQRLLNRGHLTDIELDDRGDGLKAYVGYRLKSPFAFEAGYASFSGPKSTINVISSPSTTPQIASDVADEHPVSGRGFTLAVRWIPLEIDRFQLFGTLGGWVWDADVDTQLAPSGVRVNIHRDGVDPFFGVGLHYRFSRRLGVRVEVERYTLDGDPLDAFSAGLTLKL